MNKEEINKRFVEAVNYLLSNNIVVGKGLISESLNIKASKFSEILNYRMNVGTDLAAKISDLYNIDANWLLTGRGSMLKSDTTPLMDERVPTPTPEPMEESLLYTMYKEEKTENKELIEQIGALKQTIRQLEERIEGLQAMAARPASGNEAVRDASIAGVG